MAFWTSLALLTSFETQTEPWSDAESDQELTSGGADEQENSLTALPDIPDPIITALPSAWTTPHRAHKQHISQCIQPEERNPHREQAARSPSTVPFRKNVRKLLLEIYGKQPSRLAVLESTNQPSMAYPTGFKLILLLLSGALPYVVAVIDDTIIATIIPVLVSEFKSPAEIGWYASGYFLPLTIFMPVVGKCYSLWKIKRIFFGSLVILLVGSIICARATTSSAFIAGRVISGTGAAGIINGAMRIIGVSSSRKARTFLEAAGALFMGVCTVSGPILGGVISVHWGWRWAFWINVPLAGTSLVVIAVIFPAEATQATFTNLPFGAKLAKLDPIGCASLIAFLVCFITLLQNISTSLVFGPRDQKLASMAGLSLCLFIVHEMFIRPDLALIPLDVVRHRAVWACCGALFLLFAGWMNFIFFLSLFFQTVLGDSAEESAFNLLPYVVAVSIAAAITGAGVSFVRYYNPLFILGGVCFAAGAGLIIMFDENTPLSTRIGYQALMGLGVGFLLLANVAPCQTFLPEKDHAVANGLTFFSSLLGATISLPISSTLFNRTLLAKIMPLDIPSSVKVLILLDPTRIRESAPVDQLPAIVGALVSSIRRTFTLGLGFAIASAIAFWLVPWKPLLSADASITERRRSKRHSGFSRRSYAGLKSPRMAKLPSRVTTGGNATV